MLNNSFTIANTLKANIVNSMANNINTISLMSQIGNRNSNLVVSNAEEFYYINPIVCGSESDKQGKGRCGAYENDNLFFEFCN